MEGESLENLSDFLEILFRLQEYDIIIHERTVEKGEKGWNNITY